MKTSDELPDGSLPVDDESLVRLHRAYSTESMPPAIEVAIMAAAQRVAGRMTTNVATHTANHATAEQPIVPPPLPDDEGLSRLHRDYSNEIAPSVMNDAVLATARRIAARPTALRRFRFPMALAASVLFALFFGQVLLRELEPVAKVELLGPSTQRDAEERLSEIRKLLDQGRLHEATRRLDEFKQRHHQLRVPEDIERRLGKR